MNYLIIKPAGDALDLTLCVGGLTSDCVLKGRLAADGGLLVDAAGVELTTIPAAGSAHASVGKALAWLAERNLRVDAVVHHWPLPGSHGSAVRSHAGVRLSEEALGRLAVTGGYDQVLQLHAIVQAWQPACAQALYLSGGATSPELVVKEISRMGLFTPPVACPQRVRVRCEGCQAGSSPAAD